MLDYQYDDGGRRAAGYKGSASDCVVRAIAIAAGIEYKAVYREVARRFKAEGYRASGNFAATGKRRSLNQKTKVHIQREVFEAFGFERLSCSGEKPTYTEAYEQYGDCIVKTAKHVVAVKDGVLHDTFNGLRYVWEDGSVRERKAICVWVRRK